MSSCPNAPSVVTTTSLPVAASRAVTYPGGPQYRSHARASRRATRCNPRRAAEPSRLGSCVPSVTARSTRAMVCAPETKRALVEIPGPIVPRDCKKLVASRNNVSQVPDLAEVLAERLQQHNMSPCAPPCTPPKEGPGQGGHGRQGRVRARFQCPEAVPLVRPNFIVPVEFLARFRPIASGQEADPPWG
jgi:hypothetical protein